MAQAGDVVAAKYRLIHPLGIGGMGTVWRCEHMQLKLQLAIKLLDARGPAAERAVQRFTREARIAARVRHHNVVSITDFGTDGGAPYLVMELLEGVPLSERLVVADPLTVGMFLRVIEQVLQGLKAVHDKGVIHRDLKPENIFLAREDDTVVPKLLDFGVSRSVERDKGHTLTRDGIVMGTPEYIAPEQARGKMPDARSDIYSVGVVMYEALAGVAPFHADNAADVIVAVLGGAPVPLQSIRSDLDPQLTGLVAKAMAKKPDERFQSVEEMRHAVLALLRDLPELERAQLPKRFVSHSPAAERVALLTDPPGDIVDDLDRPTVAHPQTSPTARTKKWTLLGAAAVVGLGIALLLFTSEQRSEAAHAAATAASNDAQAVEHVTVALFGVPANGRVWVDGEAIVGTRVALVRGSGEHTIEVRAPGLKPWGVQYDARKDGRFEFVAEPDVPEDGMAPAPGVVEQALTAPGSAELGKQRAVEPTSGPAKPAARRRLKPNETAPAQAEPSDRSKLLRTPDF